MIQFVKQLTNDQSRRLKAYERRVARINDLETTMQALSDDEMRTYTETLKARLLDGKKVDDIAEEGFALVREASVRVLGMRHYDVQLIGGFALLEGNISEMPTGEGKTLVAALPSYVKALEGKGVHVITVNEYLATRDAKQIGQIPFSTAAWEQLARTNVSTPPVGENEFNMMLVHIETNESDVTATLLLRNGYGQDLNVEQLPLELMCGDEAVALTVVRLTEAVRGKHAYPVRATFEAIEATGPFTFIKISPGFPRHGELGLLFWHISLISISNTNGVAYKKRLKGLSKN